MRLPLFLCLIFLYSVTSAQPQAPTGESLFAIHFTTGPAWDAAKPPPEQKFFQEHSANLQRLRREGRLLIGARYADKGLIVVRTADEASARALLAADPSLEAGVFTARIDRFQPFMHGSTQASAAPADFVRAFHAAANDRQSEALSAFYAEESELIDATFAVHCTNRAAIDAWWKSPSEPYRSGQWQVDRSFAEGRHLLVEGRLVGKHFGRDYALPFATIFEFVGGKIRRQRIYIDAIAYAAVAEEMPVALRPLLAKRIDAALEKHRMEDSTPIAVAPDSRENQPSEVRQFDFWIGDWNVFRHGSDEKIGENKIYPAHDGRVLVENWTDRGGYTGMSLNTWNSATKQWQQTWMDRGGYILNFFGGLEEGKMVMVARVPQPDGKFSLNRGTWTPQPDGSVRQQFESSTDDGNTWKSDFDADYRRK